MARPGALLRLLVAAVALLTWPTWPSWPRPASGASQASHIAQGGPTCRFSVGTVGWQPCAHFQASDNCCAGGQRFPAMVASTAANGVVDATVNVTFRYTEKNWDAFLVGRADGCSAQADCFRLEPGPSPADAEEVLVEVARLPGLSAYKVTPLDTREFQKWLSNRTSDECKFLSSSMIQLDLIGSDAHLRLHAPLGFAAEVEVPVSSVCVTLFSSGTNFSCHVNPKADMKRLLCMDKPYQRESTLVVANATGLHNGSHAYPYHCSVVYTHQCPLLASAALDLLVGTRPLAVPAETSGPGSAALVGLWATVAAACVACVLIAVGAVCLRCYCSERRLRVPTEEVGVLHERPSGQYRDVVLLYCKEYDVHFERLIRHLRDMMSCEGRVRVLDPYHDPEQWSNAALHYRRALSLVTLPESCVVLLATPQAVAVQGTVFLDSVFDQYFATALAAMEAHPEEVGRHRVLTVTMDPDLPIGWPSERVYLLPHNTAKLLNDICSAPEVSRHTSSQERLEMRIRDYYSSRRLVTKAAVPD